MADEPAGSEEEVVSEEEAAAAKKAKPARKSDMLIVIIIGVMVMILTPLASYFVVRKAAPASAEKEIKVVAGEETVLEMRAVNVNIFGTKGTRFIRLQPNLVLSESRLWDELNRSMQMLTDRVILATGRRTLDELEGPKGREALKRDIMSEINASIKGRMSGAVIDVYFTEFLIQ